MTIASKANLAHRFHGLGIEKRPTTDYTNNADGEATEKNGQ